MNVHINLDLGQAAALTSPKNKINSLEKDFMEVNRVLAELIDVMQKKLGRVSRMMFLLDWIGHRSDERLANFSMVKARDQAWNLAEELSQLSGNKRQARIDRADRKITLLSKILIYPPGIILNLMSQIMAMFEEKKIDKIIEKLKED